MAAYDSKTAWIVNIILFVLLVIVGVYSFLNVQRIDRSGRALTAYLTPPAPPTSNPIRIPNYGMWLDSIVEGVNHAEREAHQDNPRTNPDNHVPPPPPPPDW